MIRLRRVTEPAVGDDRVGESGEEAQYRAQCREHSEQRLAATV
jgi:hypothetical protein